MSNADMDVTSSIYLAVLSADEPSPLARESDEEAGSLAAGEEENGDEEEPEEPAPVRIDFEGLRQRILAQQ